MKIFSFILILISILITSLHGQWIVLDTFTGNHLHDIEFDRTFPPPDTGWVLSQQDTVFFTSDGGKSWIRSNANISGTAFALKFINQGSIIEGLMVGSSGQAWLSDNAGSTWFSTLPTGVTVPLLSIDFLRDLGSHAWAVGNNETIIYTNNLGSSWAIQNTGSNLLNSVDFVDRNNGWAVGDQGTILHSLNGSAMSADWTSQASPVDVNLNDVYFVSSNKGWIAGDSGTILITNSGGDPWEEQNTGLTDNLFGISLSDASNGVVVGENGTILHTKDGGTTWVDESSPVNDLLYKVVYLDLENCWVIGKNTGSVLYSEGSITLTSLNGGAALEGDSEERIEWESNYLRNVKIEFSIDNGEHYEPVSEEARNWYATTGSYLWTVPTGINSNQCLIKITGVGPRKASVKDSSNQVFTIFIPDTTDPEISIQPPTVSRQGDDIPISAKITDSQSPIKEVLLHYRLAGKIEYNTITMEMDPVGSDSFKAAILWPLGQEQGIQGFEFFISATDDPFFGDVKNVTFPGTPPHFIPIQIVNLSRSVIASIPERPRYQMISIPLEFEQNDGSIDSILVDDFGPYDLENPTEWRLFRWLTRDKKNGEFLVDPIGQFEPGKAFWLVARKAGVDIETGMSVQAQDFQIVLEPNVTSTPLDGWNQIGHPFAFSVSWDSIMTASGNPEGIGRPYRRDTEKDTYEMVNELLPWNGYFVKNPTSNAITLTVPHRESSEASTSFRFPFSKIHTPTTEWSLQILADSKGFRDDVNFLGMYPPSQNQWDRQDQPEPPTIGEFVSLYFPHLDWQKFPDYYTTDFRPHFQNGQSWEFAVKTNIRDQVTLIFEGVESIPSEFEVWLVDKVVKISQNLRKLNYYFVAGAREDHPKLLKLVVGTSDYIGEEINELQLVPTTFELSQNFPNPFNAATTIRYGLPKAERVTLKIFNLLGEEVVILVNDEQQSTGYHLAIWDGRNKNGQPVASGIYIYQLHAGSFSMTKKMIMVK